MSFTPMDLRHYTVPELRTMAKEAPANIPAGGFSKLRKAALIDFIVAAHETDEMLNRAEQAEGELAGDEDMTGHWAEDLPQAVADHDAEELTYLTDEQLQGQVGDAMVKAVHSFSRSTEPVAQAFTVIDSHVRETARKLGVVAWANHVAVIRSMGHTVRGKVVDTVLREVEHGEAGRVLLVVEHPNGAKGRKATRTLHRLVDVKFEALTS